MKDGNKLDHFVSIIIPTKDRPRMLERALASIRDVDYPKDKMEVIVIDSSATTDTEGVVERFRNHLKFRLRYKRLNASLSKAKNLGIGLAIGDVVVTTDDDCTFPRDWLRKLLSPFNDPSVGIVGGPDLSHADDPFLSKCIDKALRSFFGSAGIHGFLPQENLANVVRLSRFYPMGCNMAIRKKALSEIGPFLQIQPGEDTELCYRVKRAGYDIVCAREAFVWHSRRATIGGFFYDIKKRAIMRARLKFIYNYDEAIEPVYILPTLTLLSAISLFLASFFNVAAQVILRAMAISYIGLAIITGLNAAWNLRKPLAVAMIPMVILIQHATYGIYFLLETLRIKIFRAVKV